MLDIFELKLASDHRKGLNSKQHFLHLLLLSSKNLASGRQRISRPMRITGPIQFWRGCMIYLFFLERERSCVIFLKKRKKRGKEKKIPGKPLENLGKTRENPGKPWENPGKTQKNPEKTPGKPREYS